MKLAPLAPEEEPEAEAGDAEPSANGKRLLMVEDYGVGSIGGILYSVNAQNYKWIGLAFTSDEAIVFGDGVWPEKKSNHMRIRSLHEFVTDAKRLLSKSCVPPPGTRLRPKSPCWPDLSAE